MTKAEGFEYQSVQTLKGVGPAVAAKLEKLGFTLLDPMQWYLDQLPKNEPA